MASSLSSAVEPEQTNGLHCFGCWNVPASMVSETTSTSLNRRRVRSPPRALAKLRKRLCLSAGIRSVCAHLK